MWAGLAEWAPHTKAVLEAAARAGVTPTLGSIPECFDLGGLDPASPEWVEAVGGPTAIEPSVTLRELLLRYLLCRVVVDQGADIDGVEMWYRDLIDSAYAAGIPIIHRPSEFVTRYMEVLDIAHSAAHRVIAARAEAWAAESPKNRSAGSYTPFFLGSMPGSKHTHWYLSSRLYPALLLGAAVPGGITSLVFEAGGLHETAAEMAHRLRDDQKHGLGWCIGDKAAALFVKWAIGTMNLTPPTRDWTAFDVPIPMDQRIGRVMMRSGFMDEFFDAAYLIRKYPGSMFDNRAAVPVPADPGALPDGPFHLTVKKFRESGRVRRPAALAWVKDEWEALLRTKRRTWPPQEVMGLLCISLSSTGTPLTPVQLDDYFMEIAGRWCTDIDPQCNECPLASNCQANNQPDRRVLKRYFT